MPPASSNTENHNSYEARIALFCFPFFLPFLIPKSFTVARNIPLMNSRIPRPFQTHKTRRTAFTLIELLTVVAIIGILSAILIPTVAKVRQSARSAQCKSNLRQIGIGLAAYMVDSKTGILPGMIGKRFAGTLHLEPKARQHHHCRHRRGLSASSPQNVHLLSHWQSH